MWENRRALRLKVHHSASCSLYSLFRGELRSFCSSHERKFNFHSHLVLDFYSTEAEYSAKVCYTLWWIYEHEYFLYLLGTEILQPVQW